MIVTMPVQPAESGDLVQSPLAEILAYLDRRRLTGSLEIFAGARTHGVGFTEGRPTKVRLAAPVELLGNILVDIGAVTAARMNEALALQAADRRWLGEILLAAGWTTPAALENGIREQVRRRLQRLFLLGGGGYRIVEEANPLGGWGGQGVPVDPLEVIPAGVRAGHEQADLERRCAGAIGAYVVAASLGPEFNRLGLTEAEKGACRFLARGEWDTRVFESVPQEHRGALAVAAYCLLLTGQVHTTRAEASAPPPPPQSERLATAPDVPPGSERFGSAPPAIAPPPSERAPSVPPSSQRVPAASASAEPSGLRSEVYTLYADLASRNHFEVLGLSRNATANEVEERYLDLVKRYHPDRAAAQGLTDLRVALDEILIRLKDAYETLIDRDRRERYVATLTGEGGAEEKARTMVEAALAGENAYQMAIVCERQKRWEDAERYAREAVGHMPDQGEYVSLLISIQASRRPAGAPVDDLVRDMLEAVARAPKSERAQMQAARLLQRAGRPNEAAEYFRKVVALNEHNVDAAREVRLIEMRAAKRKEGGGLLGKLLDKIKR